MKIQQVKGEEKALKLSGNKNSISVYTDGSYGEDKGNKVYSGGYVLLKEGEIVKRNSVYGDNEGKAKMQNVSGEILGVVHAINYIQKQYPTVDKIYLFVDYEGLIYWSIPKAKGGWNTNNQYTKDYANYIQKMKKEYGIEMYYVESHAHDKYNEEADTLASYGKILYNEKREFNLDEYLKNYSYIEKQKNKEKKV